MMIHLLFSVYVVPSVRFEQPAYSVDEYQLKYSVCLLLSNPSATDIIVMVSTMDGSATGE